ncbi:unnamed protein product [Amaranthus hypochondriacus]
MAKPTSSILTVLALIFLLASPISTQSNGKISINQSLTATINSSPWLSPKDDFAFGFRPYPNNKSDQFLLAIWYAKIPETIVWYSVQANEGNPIPKGSTLTLTAASGLVLNDPNNNPIWNTTAYLTAPGFISYGFLNDTGNFVLKMQPNEAVVWQSFDHPRDTLLPTQVIKPNSMIFSRLSERNLTKGRFLMNLTSDGRVVLMTRDPDTNFIYEDPYYESNISVASNVTNSRPKMVYDESGNMFIIQGNNNSRVNLTPDNLAPGSENYFRATLNYDGVLTWYYHPRNFTKKNDVWYSIKAIPKNICIANLPVGSGKCGYNSICRISNEQRPICTCPESYSLIDPKSENTFGSCQPNFSLDYCHKTEQEERRNSSFVQLQGIDWPQQDYAIQTCTEDVCKFSCMSDCFCAAAIYERSSNTCWKKKLPLTNGVNDSSITRVAWLKVGSNNSSATSQESLFDSPRKKRKSNTIFAALLGVSVFVNFLVVGAIGLRVLRITSWKKFRDFDGDHAIETLREYGNVNCFSYHELQNATQDFKEEIGRGAFGVVYKGIIKARGTPTLVAVKKLDRMSEDADKEFKTEVNAIGQTHHKNLVRLVGFCKERDQRLLVYEYMSNGNLANYLFREIRPSWSSRIQIALGTARGLSYLHEECSIQIIHCDVKPQNVLLDDYHNARIADFGLAKLLALNQTQTNTMIRGTKGYVAPEWFRHKPVSVKVDVYSFGILLLEIISCRKSVSMDVDDETAILTDWALDCYRANDLESLAQGDKEALEDRLCLRKFVMVALWCIQEDSNVRPTMKRVTQMLEGVAEVPNPPSPTSFSIITQSWVS